MTHPTKVGQRVRLKTDVDRYPQCFARKGDTGTVTTLTPGEDTEATVCLEKHHEGLDEDDNNLDFYNPKVYEADWDYRLTLEVIEE